jgi:hypothetical protein
MRSNFTLKKRAACAWNVRSAKDRTARYLAQRSSPCNRLSIGWHSRWQRNHFVQANEHFTRHKLLVLLNERTGGWRATVKRCRNYTLTHCLHASNNKINAQCEYAEEWFNEWPTHSLRPIATGFNCLVWDCFVPSSLICTHLCASPEGTTSLKSMWLGILSLQMLAI